MANRVPLVVDVSDNNKIKELPVGDNLDLSGSDISQVGNITSTGIIRQGGLPVSTFSGVYADLQGLPNIPITTSDLVNDGDGNPGLVFITAADIPPFTDTLADVVSRGQTSLDGIIIATATLDVGLSVGTQNNNVANFTFNNVTDIADTPAQLKLRHSDQALGKLADITFDGVDNAGNSVDFGHMQMSVSNNTQTGLESRYEFSVRGGNITNGALQDTLRIDKNGITIINGRITGNIDSSTSSSFNAITAQSIAVANTVTVGDIVIDASQNSIASGTTRLNIGSNNTNITIGGAGNQNVDIESAKVNITNILEVDGELKAQAFPLSATFTGGLNVTGTDPNMLLRSTDAFNNNGSTATFKIQSDRKNPAINSDMGEIEFIGLSAQDSWASYRTVAKIRVGTEDDESVLSANQSSFFYKFEVFDNTHTPVQTGNYTSVPFVIGYNSEPSGASGDAYKATIVNFYNSRDDFIVLGGSVDINGFPNKLLWVDYSTENTSVHGDFTAGGNLIVSGTGTSSIAGDLTVTGDLTISGTTTTVNSTTLEVTDLNITVAKDAANANAANGGGLTVDLGTDGAATLTYVSATDRWQFDRDLGASNMYATNFTGALIGNASTATTLQNTRSINNVNFNGSANITITAQTDYALTAGTGISLGSGVTTWSGDAARTISNTDLGSDQDIIKTITVADAIGSFVMAETGSYSVSGNSDEFTFIGSTAIDIDIDATNGAIQILNTGVTALTTGTGLSTNTSATGAVSITNTDRGSDQNIFKTVAVTGSNSIVADSNTDTLTVSAGSGISLTGNSTTDTLTIANSGVISIANGTATSVTNDGAGTFTVNNTGVTSISGTASEIEVSASTGSVTVGLPANIQTTNATFTGNLVVNGNTTLGNQATDSLTIGAPDGNTPTNTATPAGYMEITLNGSTVYIPYYT